MLSSYTLFYDYNNNIISLDLVINLMLFSDQLKPQFTSCPTEPVFVRRLGTINVTPPSVTDNSGAIASLTVNYNLNSPVTEDVSITWKAKDHAGNEADPCVVEVHVKGMKGI